MDERIEEIAMRLTEFELSPSEVCELLKEVYDIGFNDGYSQAEFERYD